MAFSKVIFPLTFIVIFLLNFVHPQSLYAFYCSDQYCTDFSDCTDMDKLCRANSSQTHFPSPVECNCCKFCFDYLKEGDDCTVSSLSWPKQLCGPELECREQANDPTMFKCEKKIPLDTTSCLYIRNEYMKDKEEGIVGVAQYLPECDARGNFAPKQCLPGSICYCANPKGERIFGVGIFSEKMDCECSRDIERIRRLGLGQADAKWPHCLENGDYDDLQCYGTTCYCRYEPKIRVRIQLISSLPCYNKDKHGAMYLHQCEDKYYTKQAEIYDADVQNQTLIISDMPVCSEDGHYAPIQSRNGYQICVDKEGYQISTYGAKQFTREAEIMNCFCAIDELTSKTVGSATGRAKCKENGNYQDRQCFGNICFCMTPEGHQDTRYAIREVHIDDINLLPC